MATKTNGYTKGRARQNTSLSKQRTDYGLRAEKTYSNAKSRAKREEDSWEAMDDSTEGCNQEGTSVHSKQTSV